MPGKNVIEKETCLCCKFWRWSENSKRWECHRNAPQHLCGVGSGYEEHLWPEVVAGEWCGEWEKSPDWIYS